MFFSPFTPFESTGGSIDPLGFLQPGSVLADQIFPQFTVLSRHPAYHGFFCFAFRRARERTGATRQKTTFARDFRWMEALWGLAHVARNAGAGVLNVQRYKGAHALGAIAYGDTRLRRIIFQKMQYGILSHYANPSRQWRLLNPKGDTLTGLGESLADAWGSRGKNTLFAELLDRWENNRLDLKNNDALDAFAGYFLNEKASSSEIDVWREIIDRACREYPVVAPLWKKSMDPHLFDLLCTDDQKYASFFPSLLEQYASHPELCRRFEACNGFEQFAALVQGVFDWEYLRRLNEYRDLPRNNDFTDIEEGFRIATRDAAVHCRETMPPGSRWNLPTKIGTGNIASYTELAGAVITHHAEHQRRKGAVAYIDGEAVTVAGKIDAPATCEFMIGLRNNPASLLQQLRARHRRNWYFFQNQQWIAYTGELRE